MWCRNGDAGSAARRKALRRNKIEENIREPVGRAGGSRICASLGRTAVLATH